MYMHITHNTILSKLALNTLDGLLNTRLHIGLNMSCKKSSKQLKSKEKSKIAGILKYFRETSEKCEITYI